MGGPIRRLSDALAQVFEESTALGRLRLAALRLDMPLAQVTGDEVERGLHHILVAMAATGVDWDEAALPIVAAPARLEVGLPSPLD
jgi:hypothetical protein